MSNNKILFLSVILAAMISITPLYAQDKVYYKARVTWQGVAGAGGYLVEIKDESGTVVFRKETRGSEVVPRLPAGDYMLRISVLDKFQTLADSTPWTKIAVRRTETPFFESITPSKFIAGGKADDVTVDGDSFDEKMTVSVRGRSGTVPVTGLDRSSKEKVTFDLDLTNVPEGSYSLVLENPEGKKLVVDNKILVEKEDPSVARDREARKGRVYAALGYEPLMPLSPWNSVLKPSFAGGNVFVAHSLCGLPFMGTGDTAKKIGVELIADMNRFKTKEGENRRTGTMNLYSAYAGMYGTFPIGALPLEFVIHGAMGYGRSTLSLSGSEGSQTYTSGVICFRGGPALRYYIGQTVYAELGIDYKRYFFKGEQFQGAAGILRFGVRL